MIAILTSFAASIMFWIFFEWIPRNKEKKKIKPLVDFELYRLNGKLFFLIEAPFRMNEHSPSNMQDKIKMGLLTKSQFERYLSTKCLTEDYQNIDDFAKNLVPIGRELKEKTDEILSDIQRLFVLNKFLSADQIIAIRRISEILKTYDYDFPASIKVGNSVLVPVDPTMRHYAHLFFPLYQAYLQLKDYLETLHGSNTEFGDYYIELNRDKICQLLFEEKYSVFLKKTRRSKDPYFLSGRFLSYFYLNQQENLILSLESFLHTSTLRLISLRSTFFLIYDNPIIKDNLIRLRGEVEYNEMVKCIKDEINNTQLIESFVDEMYNYYEKKLDRHTKENSRKYQESLQRYQTDLTMV